jgi:hypothetical protein
MALDPMQAITAFNGQRRLIQFSTTYLDLISRSPDKGYNSVFPKQIQSKTGATIPGDLF